MVPGDDAPDLGLITALDQPMVAEPPKAPAFANLRHEDGDNIERDREVFIVAVERLLHGAGEVAAATSSMIKTKLLYEVQEELFRVMDESRRGRATAMAYGVSSAWKSQPLLVC